MKMLLLILFVLFFYFLGAYMHEGDIQAMCKESGKSGYSTWKGELKCSPLKNH